MKFRKPFRQILMMGFALVILVPFQNCGESFQSMDDSSGGRTTRIHQAVDVGAQTITFSSTNQDFPNPERGISRMLSENLTHIWKETLIKHVQQDGLRLVSHREVLQPYVDTPVLPQAYLDLLNAKAALHRAHGTKMIMQFSYDNTGGAKEPKLGTVVEHIKQLKPFFIANADVIATIHAGFLGLYGEWAFSSEPSIGVGTPSAAARIAVRDALLASTDKSTPIAWRTLPDLMSWYPTPLTAAQAFSGSDQARSGIGNDCFLSNKDDSGTYWKQGVADTGRTLSNPFRAYHNKVSEWTTTGGENCGDGEFKLCADVLHDGAAYRWRYLRDDWGQIYHKGWDIQGCYPQVLRSLGYRFQLDSVSHVPSSRSGNIINVNVNIRNLGWSRILSARKMVVTLRHRTSGALITGSAGDMRLLPSQATSSTRIDVPVVIPANASSGDYDVYLSMPDIWSTTKNNPYYAVRFANADNLTRGQMWDAANFRFKTGSTVSLNAAAQVDTQPPSVPGTLSAQPVSPSQINLSWIAATDNVGVKGYVVYVNNLQVAFTTSRSYAHTGLAANTTYNYRVSAYDAAENYGPWTVTAVSAKTLAAAPTGLLASLSTNATTVSFQIAVIGFPAFVRFLVDTDKNVATGLSASGIGANYLIENGALYRYSGSGTSWQWTLLGRGVQTTVNGKSVYTFLRSDFGSPTSIKFMGQTDSPLLNSAVVDTNL